MKLITLNKITLITLASIGRSLKNSTRIAVTITLPSIDVVAVIALNRPSLDQRSRAVIARRSRHV